MSVYCVFVRDNGGLFLEKIFDRALTAEYYIAAQPKKYQSMYHWEEWEVE